MFWGIFLWNEESFHEMRNLSKPTFFWAETPGLNSNPEVFLGWNDSTADPQSLWILTFYGASDRETPGSCLLAVWRERSLWICPNGKTGLKWGTLFFMSLFKSFFRSLSAMIQPYLDVKYIKLWFVVWNKDLSAMKKRFLMLSEAQKSQHN